MKKKENILSLEQINEFNLNRLGYYCRVRTVWSRTRNKSDYSFDIVQYDNDKEVIIQKGIKVFPLSEHEAIKKRNEIISFYLKKLKNN